MTRNLDRYEAPNYLAKYRERRSATTARGPAAPAGDDGTPLYLRRFRERTNGNNGVATTTTAPPTTFVEHEGARFTPALAAATRGKEISAPLERRSAEKFVCEISIIRHGVTQGYSTDAGLTPMGSWQAHQRGHELSRRWNDGERIRLVHADTNRARQTAEQLYNGAKDGLALWGKEVVVSEPEPIPELRNFGVWTPDGLRDVTSAFRQYQSTMEKLERMAVGERPRWLVEIDRFYRVQLGGADPIQMWLTIPLMYFEPPAMCVRRFWRGFHRLIAEYPEDTRILAATHSGPMRAFATWAHGYDPGEPLNTEEIRVKLREGGQTALVSYRNRVTEVNVPPPDEFPAWEA